MKMILKVFSIFLLFCLLFSGCSEIDGQLHTEDSYQGIYIDFSPDDAQISIDHELLGNFPSASAVDPGQVVRIDIYKEGYIPYSSEVSVPPSGHLMLRGVLAPLVSSTQLSEKGTQAGWFGSSICFISFMEPYRLLCGMDENYTSVHIFSSYPTWIHYSKFGVTWSEKTIDDNTVYILDDLDGSPQIISTVPTIAHWLFEEDAVLLMEEMEETLHLRIVYPDGKVSDLQLSQELITGDLQAVTLSADQQWLVTLVSGHMDLWKFEKNLYVYQHSMDNVLQVSFSSESSALLGLVDIQYDLHVMDLPIDSSVKISSHVLGFDWVEGTSSLVYSRSTNENSSIFYLYDASSNISLIVADPSVVIGNVENVDVNKNMNKILYGNRYGRMFLLDFSYKR